ncbi:hypothetical protein DLE01_41290, partial [Streptomyces sp. FT05W]
QQRGTYVMGHAGCLQFSCVRCWQTRAAPLHWRERGPPSAHRYDQALTGAAPAHGALTRPPLPAGA